MKILVGGVHRGARSDTRNASILFKHRMLPSAKCSRASRLCPEGGVTGGPSRAGPLPGGRDCVSFRVMVCGGARPGEVGRGPVHTPASLGSRKPSHSLGLCGFLVNTAGPLGGMDEHLAQSECDLR